MKSSSTDGTLRSSRSRAAQYLLRDGMRSILGPVGLRVEPDHAQRITVLPTHEVGDGGFKVGAVEIGLGERRAEPAVVIDDDVAVLGRPRNNRGPFTHTQQLPLYGQSLHGQGWG